MKILYVKHRTPYGQYLDTVLSILVKKFSYQLKTISIRNFLDFNVAKFDVILYQTQADHRSTRKFPKKLLEATDLKFLSIKGKQKILVDAHDDGDHDAFCRFRLKEFIKSSDDLQSGGIKIKGISQYSNEKYEFNSKELESAVTNILEEDPLYFNTIPRIKNTPSSYYMDDFNVIMSFTYPVKKFDLTNDSDRDCSFHYWAKENHDTVRPLVQTKLKSLKDKFNLNLDILSNFPRSLRNFLCEINVPGRGKACIRHLECLSNSCLMLAHEDIQHTYFLPNDEMLKPNEDYILFNINNLEEKMDFINSNIGLCNQIRRNSHQKFLKSYCPETTAITFNSKLCKI
jgi:hypothetical protein